MKGTKILALAVAATVMTGCSTTNLNPFGNDPVTSVSQPTENGVAVKDKTVGLVYDEGVKIVYTLLGKIKRIEVYGVAPAWKGNVEILAEADAKERLVKYLYDEQVETQRSVEVIARTLDKARDNALNPIGDAELTFDAEEIEAEVEQDVQYAQKDKEDNTSRRIAQRVEETKIRELIKITSGGTLRGVRKVGHNVEDDGKLYVAKYEWSPDAQDTANKVRQLMFK